MGGEITNENTPFKCTEPIFFYNGTKIPAIGLGTWQSSEEEVYDAVLSAIKVGYRHIDTASAYGNEPAIGRAIKDSGINRNELFVTTKLWCTDHTRPEYALRESLKKLNLSYVDLYLMHWPVPLNPNGNDPKFPKLPNGNRDIDNNWDFIKTWELLQQLLPTGLTKNIGVSNLSVTNLLKLLESKETKVKPVVNQVEMHPFLPQNKLLKFAKQNGIVIEAYSPLGSTDSPVLQNETIKLISEKLSITPATLVISWAIWRGTVVLPKSTNPARIEANLKIVDLLDEDGRALDKISVLHGERRIVSPDWYPIKVFNDEE
ncbi:uncharacterized protein PRCAT00005830001 [Priceomyces carsonii]|uniref:uncharacterized protein n=1 Tax=Priceomyces carsonii TaxID=28549 RepID=UPI002EDB3F19|nr:unnamed protein product [Priceomyces carsonii]